MDMESGVHGRGRMGRCGERCGVLWDMLVCQECVGWSASDSGSAGAAAVFPLPSHHQTRVSILSFTMTCTDTHLTLAGGTLFG